MKKITLDFNKPSVGNVSEMAGHTLAQGGYDLVGYRQKMADLVAQLDVIGDDVERIRAFGRESMEKLNAQTEKFQNAIKALKT